MNKVCIVPIFGDYDNLKEPTIISEGWKYIVVSDRHHKSDVWKTKIFKGEGLTNKQKAGYVITQPNKIVDYDVCLLVGGQIQINTDLNNYLYEEEFVSLDHPSRNCTYKEAMACILLNKDEPKVIAQQMYRYLEAGFPTNNGMIQTGVTIRKRNKNVIDFCAKWWENILRGSHRDQLAFNYTNWKHPINYKTISSKLLHKEFRLNNHK